MIAQFVITAVVLQLVVAGPVSYYKPLTPEQAARLASWTPESKEPIWQLSGQYQGDIVLTPAQRNGAVDQNLRWPKREIPYKFSPELTERNKEIITRSLKEGYDRTCVRPRPATDDDVDYVYITAEDTGCWSSVGRIGGRQILNLQRDECIWYDVIIHEFLHAAGFYHQQSATERDDYVDILWENIIKGEEHNFEKLPKSMVSSFGEKYDYRSILHFHMHAYSSNGKPTVVPKDPTASIGTAEDFSSIDIAKLNKMYNCV